MFLSMILFYNSIFFAVPIIERKLPHLLEMVNVIMSTVHWYIEAKLNRYSISTTYQVEAYLGVFWVLAAF